MSRSALLLAIVAAVVVVVGMVALVRGDDPVASTEPVLSASTPVTTGTGASTIPTSVAAATTVPAGGDVTTTAAGGREAMPAAAEIEPPDEFAEEPVLIDPPAASSSSGGRQVSTSDSGKGEPGATTATGGDVTPAVPADEPALELGEDYEEAGPPKETTTSTSPVSQRQAGSGSTGQGRMYTWHDGGDTRQVWLEPDLVVKSGGAGKLADVVAEAAGGSVVRSDGGGGQDGWPVFRSRSGSLMTLPGGVLLVLDPEWSESETDAFFSSNGIKMASVSELGYLPNGFFVDTDPGFPSLDLANELAGQEGVELSSPNWWRESSTR